MDKTKRYTDGQIHKNCLLRIPICNRHPFKASVDVNFFFFFDNNSTTIFSMHGNSSYLLMMIYRFENFPHKHSIKKKKNVMKRIDFN